MPFKCTLQRYDGGARGSNARRQLGIIAAANRRAAAAMVGGVHAGCSLPIAARFQPFCRIMM